MKPYLIFPQPLVDVKAFELANAQTDLELGLYLGPDFGPGFGLVRSQTSHHGPDLMQLDLQQVLHGISLRVSLRDLQIYLLTFSCSKKFKNDELKLTRAKLPRPEAYVCCFGFLGKYLTRTHQLPHN
jgi:hypothetical protein